MSEEDKAYAEIAARNARAAINTAEETRFDLMARMNDLETQVRAQSVSLAQLQVRYGLLMAKVLGGGPTSGTDG